jgi:hypothetical protein
MVPTTSIIWKDLCILEGKASNAAAKDNTMVTAGAKTPGSRYTTTPLASTPTRGNNYALHGDTGKI